MPTFILFKKTRSCDTLQGADPDKLKALIEKHGGAKFNIFETGQGVSLGGGAV